MPHKRAKRSIREKRRVESGADLVPGVRRAIEDEDIPKSAVRVLNAAKIQQDWAEKKRKRQDEHPTSGIGGEDAAGPSRKKRKGLPGGDGQGQAEVNRGGGGSGGTTLRIQPGESMAHFNRRVEDTMRHSVREAMQSSSAKARRARKDEQDEQRARKSGRVAAAPNSTPKADAQRRGKDGVRGGDVEESELDDERARAPLRSAATKGGSKPKEFERISSSAPKRLNDIVLAPPQIKNLPRKAKKLAALGGSQKTDGAKSLREGVISMAQKASMEEQRDRAIRLYREMKRGKVTS
ncbi:hypothetical protein BC628DRAFT_579095 [Trametes gibbosa]|nr:hypothetical protein BC628DRAFT_579095 [Trametes gibbosa]